MKVALERIQSEELRYPLEGTYYYKGFRYYWTGWQTFVDSTRIVGQWIAFNENGNRIYSSVPGACSDFIAGDIFNISPQLHQSYLEEFTKEETKELEKDKGLELLKQVIDALEERKNVQNISME